VGIELQTLDSVGTVWPERQRKLKELGVPRVDNAESDFQRSFGMNWKMTAKTILVQMHHKIETFEHVDKKLVLVIQDRLLVYMTKQFNFGHLSSPALLGESMHFHAYRMIDQENTGYKLSLQGRLSTDVAGIAACLGLHAKASVELEEIVHALQTKISRATVFIPLWVLYSSWPKLQKLHSAISCRIQYRSRREFNDQGRLARLATGARLSGIF
jgi:hypothetical protein